MSNQKFSAAEREAIWLAHEKKCAYTRELVDISNLHIDHILPESLADDPIVFEQIKLAFGLDETFDLLGFENLLPCNPGVNLQKGSILLESAPFHFFLSLAATKKAEIKRNLEKIEKRKNRGRALILLQQCLEREELSPKDVARILEQHDEEPQNIFQLIEGMKFADATEVRAVAKADIHDLRNRPIKFGPNSHIDRVTLTNDLGEATYVRTCNEYETAIASGYSPASNFDLKMAVFLKHQCGLLKALEAATSPITSFIAEPKVGIVDLDLLPFSFFPLIGDSPDSPDVDATYQNKVEGGSLVIRRIKQNLLVIEEPEGMGQQLIEVARADFNNDQIEDILLFEYCYATHGTLGFGGIKIITRKGPNSRFENVEI